MKRYLTNAFKACRTRIRTLSGRLFFRSEVYWEKRYASGSSSGTGSCGKLAEFKAEILNTFVQENNVRSVIEFGSGDGQQLSLAQYPRYRGFDVSQTAVRCCREKFRSDSTKQFRHLSEYRGEKAELVLSLDVIYHLIEDRVFEAHMAALFDAASRFVIIYSDDGNRKLPESPYIRHRRFQEWIEKNRPNWRLQKRIPNAFRSREIGSCNPGRTFVYEASSDEQR
ncbi:MAG: class I SAM-dependent methyltransferase [Bdellovibrionota bacterium]